MSDQGSIKDIVTEFLDKANISGLRKIMEARNLPEKILWFLIVALGFCFAGYQIVKLTSDFNDNIRSRIWEICIVYQGLELLLNVQEADTVPFVTQTSGIHVMINDPGNIPIQNGQNSALGNTVITKGTLVPTGFEAIFEVSESRTERTKGSLFEDRCDDTNDETLDLCMYHCEQKHITEICGCVREFYTVSSSNNDSRPCGTTEDYLCINEVVENHIRVTPEVCKACKVKCNEVYYDPRVVLTKYPSSTFLPTLATILGSPDYNDTADNFTLQYTELNLVHVRVSIASLQYELTKEDTFYKITTFLSNIGGSLGFAGLSFVSGLQVAGLVVVLSVALEKRCRKRKRTIKEQH